ncbi:hypothetical protein GCM10010124_10090 [Pilimelia terevasa]|uniref:Orc1-like AAA ATPase domain-containing protein n=1 Tax=Pilimelia terevasa TaxID=53372 RepID=A0A8J3BLC3_9ACTN|nr:AAA family ATPase [Pilimelia terevasa]GGK19477.1 hypothetical protein GCM10010124_10090 [Pilimelia terevasa]
MATRLADRLADARQRGFVGRTAELAAFGDLLRGADSRCLLHLHGPGGVGKTTLLRQFAARAGATGRTVHWLDGRDLAAGPVDALREALPAGPADPLAALADLAGALLVVDTIERLGAAERWLWDELLPRLPGGVVAVLAGRDRIPARLRADPGWRALLRSLPLGNLDPDDAVALLRHRGVPAHACAAALEFTHGHPLALALVGDVCAATGGPPTPAATREVLGTLLRELIDAVPDPRHRAALEAAAQVRATTEPLLAALLDLPDAHAEFAWLRGLSVIDEAGAGLAPHDLAREVLAGELRWRHPRQHAEIRQRARAWYRERFAAADAAGQQAVLADYAFLHRHAPGLAAMLAHVRPDPADAFGLRLVAAGPAELPALRALVAAHEGERSAAAFAHWAAVQPEGVQAVRRADGALAGLQLLVALDRTTSAQRAADPGAEAAWAYLQRHAPVGRGDRVTVVRHWLDAVGYQAVSPVQTMLSLHLVRHYLTTPGLAFHFLVCADPASWAEVCAYVDFDRLAGADFAVGGRQFGVYGHDWRATPPLAWLARLADREEAEAGGVDPEPVPALDEAAFAAAVREALRHFERPDRLAGSPLCAAAAVRAAGTADGARAVADFLREGARALAGSARDRAGYRALHHTYLQPAGTQRAAADLLDLPTSTYRRHLAAGTARLTALLWRAETRARAG